MQSSTLDLSQVSTGCMPISRKYCTHHHVRDGALIEADGGEADAHDGQNA